MLGKLFRKIKFGLLARLREASTEAPHGLHGGIPQRKAGSAHETLRKGNKPC